MDLLIVERHADWSQWNRLARTLRQPVRVLVQEANESRGEFYARVMSRVESTQASALRRVIVLPADAGALVDMRFDELFKHVPDANSGAASARGTTSLELAPAP